MSLYRVSLCWVSLCWVSLCWMSWHPASMLSTHSMLSNVYISYSSDLFYISLEFLQCCWSISISFLIIHILNKMWATSVFFNTLIRMFDPVNSSAVHRNWCLILWSKILMLFKCLQISPIFRKMIRNPNMWLLLLFSFSVCLVISNYVIFL